MMHESRYVHLTIFSLFVVSISLFAVKLLSAKLGLLLPHLLDVSALVGALQVAAAISEYLKTPKLRALSTAIFITEFVWFVICSWFMFKGKISAHSWLTSSFVFYFILVLLIAAHAVLRDEPEKKISNRWALCEGAFGAYYAIAAIFLKIAA